MEGDVTPFNVASKLACTPAEVPTLLSKKEGERVEQECPIHASNVMLVDPATGKGTRKRPIAG